MNKKLSTKINFDFEDQDEMGDFIVDMKLKTRRKLKNTKIVEHKKTKKMMDSSTKLF
jgi:hypothetical protein